MRISLYGLILLCLMLLSIPVEAKVMVYTYRMPESRSDRRYEYDNSVLKLALEKTKQKWGDYRLVASPPMNYSRAVAMLESGKLENPMFKLSATPEYCSRLSCAEFPVDLGVVGYRVFFVSRRYNDKLSKVRTLDELKKYSIGQGSGWLDIPILRQSGFSVYVIPKYESLFSMVAKERFALLSRGVNEVEEEFLSHKNIDNFMLNRVVGLYYPLPRFFFTNKKSKWAAKRVQEGLISAYEDGSLKLLWEKMYGSSLKFSDFENINFFKIENPYLDGIGDSYKKYMLIKE